MKSIQSHISIVLAMSILMVSGLRPLNVSAQAAAPAPVVGTQTDTASSNKADLKKAVAETTKKNAEVAFVDKKTLESDAAKLPQAKKGGWNKTNVTIMVVFAAGIAVLVWLLLKYGKDCLEYSPPNCSFSDSENGCVCTQYAPEEP